MEDRKALDESLSEIARIFQEETKAYSTQNEEWWNSLTEEERENAFYAVVKRIHKAELVDQGSYRYALYEVFGFDMSMYSKGMDCGYLELHNSITPQKAESSSED